LGIPVIIGGIFDMGNDRVLKQDKIDEMIEAFQSKINYFIIDMDNSKELFGKEIPNEVINNILKIALDKYENIYYSVVGRDAIAGIYGGESLSVFDFANLKEEIQKKMSNIYEKEITFCMGISVYPDVCKQKHDIRDFALDALFTSKQKGFNQITVSSEENMKLKSVYFRKSQLVKLGYFAQKTGKPEAEIIRKALDQYLEKQLLKS